MSSDGQVLVDSRSAPFRRSNGYWRAPPKPSTTFSPSHIARGKNTKLDNPSIADGRFTTPAMVPRNTTTLSNIAGDKTTVFTNSRVNNPHTTDLSIN